MNNSSKTIVTKGRVIKVLQKYKNHLGPGSYETDPILIRKNTKSVVPWRKSVLERNRKTRKIKGVGPGSYNICYSNKMITKRSSNTIFPRASRYPNRKLNQYSAL